MDTAVRTPEGLRHWIELVSADRVAFNQVSPARHRGGRGRLPRRPRGRGAHPRRHRLLVGRRGRGRGRHRSADRRLRRDRVAARRDAVRRRARLRPGERRRGSGRLPRGRRARRRHRRPVAARRCAWPAGSTRPTPSWSVAPRLPDRDRLTQREAVPTRSAPSTCRWSSTPTSGTPAAGAPGHRRLARVVVEGDRRGHPDPRLTPTSGCGRASRRARGRRGPGRSGRRGPLGGGHTGAVEAGSSALKSQNQSSPGSKLCITGWPLSRKCAVACWSGRCRSSRRGRTGRSGAGAPTSRRPPRTRRSRCRWAGRWGRCRSLMARPSPLTGRPPPSIRGPRSR